MSEELIEDIEENKEDTKEEPLQVIIKKEETKPEPDFDHDNYLPSEEEIIETEKEIHENIKKRYVTND